MKSKLLTGSLLKGRNIGILLLSTAAAYVLRDSLPVDVPSLALYGAGVGVYGGFVLQSLTSRKFHEEFNRKEKIREIQELNFKCLRMATEAKKYTNPAYLQKLKKVMEDKNDIVNSFFKGEKSYIKEKIAEQTLNLVLAYIRLLTNFCMRSREIGETDISEVTNRINSNLRKLNFSKDPNVLADLKNVIEMDEKIINRVKDEKKDLERISAKLDYMESTVSMFKHQILSSVESEEMLEKLETAVNEAAALDSVLEDRRRTSRARL